MNADSIEFATDNHSTARSLYLDLLKRAVLATIYEESQWYVMGSRPENDSKGLKLILKKWLLNFVHGRGLLLIKPIQMTPALLAKRNTGQSSGFFGNTMIGLKRLDNIQHCVETVLCDGTEGDLIETGAWRGGACIFMRGILKAHGVTDRNVWVADSFGGFPTIADDDAAYAADANVDVDGFNQGGPMDLWLKVPQDRVVRSFEHYGLMDDQVKFLPGWFSDTLPNAPIDKLAVLRLDGDLYKSTMDALEALYHKVSVNGFVIVDDYKVWPHCKAAVDDFRERLGITSELIDIDQDSVFWQVT